VILLIDTLNRPGIWTEQVARLRALARELGLGHGSTPEAETGPEPGLDALWSALDDHGAVLSHLRQADAAWSWADFAAEVEALARDLELPASAIPPGAIRAAAVDQVVGLQAAHVLLANPR